MHALLDIPVRLLEKLTNEQHNRGRAVADLLVLCDRRPRNHRRGRVLNLHLRQQHLSVLHTVRQYGRLYNCYNSLEEDLPLSS